MTIAAGLTIACVGAITPPPAGTWQIATVVRSPQPLVAGSTVTITFSDKAPYAVSVEAGCNHIGSEGSRLESGRLVLNPPMFQTAMACDTALMAQENWVSNLIGSHPTVTMAGDQLKLSSADAEVQFSKR